MNAEIFLAKRYLKPDRSAVGVITVISIIGVALGVAVLIIVLSVMTGFTDLMKEKLLDTQAHLQVKSPYTGVIRRPGAVVKAIEEAGGKAAPIIQGPALVQIGRSLDPGIFVMGIKSSDIEKHMKIDSVLKEGNFKLNKGEIAISSALASRWLVTIGDKILLHSPKKLTEMVKINQSGKVELNEENPVYLPGEFTVSGIFSFNKSDFDRTAVFISLDDAAELFDLKLGSANVVYGWVDNPYDMAKELNVIRSRLKMSGFTVNSWEEVNSALLGVLTVEKRMMFFLLIFIVLVAAFSICNTLITSVYKKTREIGILKALGASNLSCMRIFVWQGMFVGICGSLSGVLLGVTIITFRNQILKFGSMLCGQELFPKEFYYFDGLPAHIVASDVILIVTVSILLCTVGGIIPAIRAAKLDPAKALRYE